jgi:hypothetical protein
VSETILFKVHDTGESHLCVQGCRPRKKVPNPNWTDRGRSSSDINRF